MKKSIDPMLAFGGGILLALMIQYSSIMAKYSNPLIASWATHGVGLVTSLFLYVMFARFFSAGDQLSSTSSNQPPLWAYMGGIFGTFTIMLSAITVNSALKLSGSLAIILLGQVFFGGISDQFGLFNTPQRNFTFTGFFAVLCILVGSWLIIFAR